MIKSPEKDQRWVFNKDIEGQKPADGIIRKILAYSEDAMCVENIFKKDAVGALHSHPHTQITYVAKGKFKFNVDGETHEVVQGDTILKVDNVEHGCICLEEGILVDFFSPMRKDFV